MQHLSQKFFLFILFILLPLASYAQDKQLTIVNHFKNDLKITTSDPELLPRIPSTIKTMTTITTTLRDINKEAYIRMEDNENNSAFWGVAIKNNEIKFYGYLPNGIAFSWLDQTITFCTSEVYKKENHC